MELSPALLIEHCQPSAQGRKLLRASQSQGAHFVRNGQLVRFCGAKVVRSEAPLEDVSSGGLIEIPVGRLRQPLPILDQRAADEIAATFQPKLLMYRLMNLPLVRDSNFDVPWFSSPLRELTRSLGACVPDQPDLQAALVSDLEERHEQIQSERATDLYAIVVEAVLSFCHKESIESVLAGEIADAANTLLKGRGEILEMDARSVGRKLRALGLATGRLGAAGRGILLLEGNRLRIHKLAWDYGIPPAQGSLPQCQHCGKFTQGQETSFGQGQNYSSNDSTSEAGEAQV